MGHWHNNAFHVSEILNIPSLILHYEEYNHDYNTTETNILKFLDVEKKQIGNPFHMSNYDEYFTLEEKNNITEFIYDIMSNSFMCIFCYIVVAKLCHYEKSFISILN